MNLSIAGNVGKDPETRAAGQTTVTNFSVAVSGWDGKKKEKTTAWFRVAVWGKRGEQLANVITKGSKVAVSGEMSFSEYNGKQTVELKAQDVTLLGGGTQAGASRQPSRVNDEDQDPIPF